LIAILLSSLFTIWRCQSDADSAFINLEAQAALFVIVGLLAQLSNPFLATFILQ
jgi:hypothetical protein